MNENTDNKQVSPMLWPLMVLGLVGLIIIISIIQLSTSESQKTESPQNENGNLTTPYPLQTPTPLPVAVTAPVPVPAPENKPTKYELCQYSIGTLDWGWDYSGGADVIIKCDSDTIRLSGPKVTFNLKTNEWYQNEEKHGRFDLKPVSKGNIVAEGMLVTGNGEIPLRLRRG